MATVYPSASGNWSDTSLWMEVGGNPYNQIPQIDDVVYLNGCTMTVAAGTINLGTNGEIRNDGDDGQGIVSGGNILFSATGARTFVANFYVFDNIVNITTNNTGRWQLRIDGNIYLYDSPFNSIPQNGGFNLNYLINGDVTIYGSVNGVIFTDRQGTGSSFTINGNIYSENSCTLVRNNFSTITIVGDMTGDIMIGSHSPTTLTITGDCTTGSRVLAGGATTLTYTGNLIQGSANLFSANITTFNMNGTLTQGQGQIASYITTLNLDGTLNLSGTRPFTYGIQNLNVATGGSVTYDNHLYYCFTNIVAVDSNFTITCRNQNLDNFDFKNKNLLNNTYPAQANVSDGYVYGLEDQFTGSYQLPPESVVLEGTPYGSHVGTLTLDISSSVQDTIDDIEDEVNILVDSYPPLVTLESITNIANTSATINLSVSNTALITKTGAEVDTDWNFSNPQITEVSNYVSSVNVTGLIPDTKSYARAYVVYDNKKVYSQSDNLSTLLIPSQLQLCEYLQTDGSAYVIIDSVMGNNIYSCECKCFCNQKNKYIFKCQNGSTSQFDLIVNNDSTAKYTARLFNGNTATKSNVNMGVELVYKFDRRKKVATFNSQEITFTHNPSSYNNTGLLYLFSPDYTYNGLRINYWKGNAWNILSTYIKTGETYEDNKGNTCSAGTCGFFDVLTQTFYTNDGGGNFTHGNDII